MCLKKNNFRIFKCRFKCLIYSISVYKISLPKLVRGLIEKDLGFRRLVKFTDIHDLMAALLSASRDETSVINQKAAKNEAKRLQEAGKTLI